LIQDTLDITGVGYEYDFTWVYTLETGYSVLLRWKGTAQVYNIHFPEYFLIRLQ